LTERGDNVVMWAHDANSHRGVAFKFRRLEHLDHRFLVAQPIQYRDEPVSFHSKQDDVGDLLGLSDHDPIPRSWDLEFRKHADWANEQEWRIHASVAAGEDPGPGYSDDEEPPELFEAIYLGCRMEPAAVAELVELIRAKLPQAQIFKARKPRFGIG